MKLSAPSDRVKAVLFEWFDKENCLLGLGKKAYFEDHRDLIALRPARGEDRLSQFLKDCCSHLFEVCHIRNLIDVIADRRRKNMMKVGSPGIRSIISQNRELPRP